MIGQSSWSLNRRRYGDAYRIQQDRGGGRRNINYHQQISHLRPPRRGGSVTSGRIRNEEININRGEEKLLKSSLGDNIKNNSNVNYTKIEGELKYKVSCKSKPQISRFYSKNSSSMVDLSPSCGSIIKTETSDLR